MRHAHPVETVRAAEAELLASLPAGALMQRAAAGLAAACVDLLGGAYGARVVLLVGSGDNGGDALYAGARLAARGAAVLAVAVGDAIHVGGRDALLRAGGRVVSPEGAGRPLGSADLVIDGIVGIGGRGPLRPAAADLVAAIGPTALVVACDLPSGVDADTGEVPGAAVRADLTVSFGTLKPGLLIDPGAEHVGVVHLVDIGLALPQAPVVSLQAADVAAVLAVDRQADKYSRGVLGLLAGSARYPGAAVLAAGAALATGVGYLQVAAGRGVSGPVRLAWPEAVVHADGLPARVDAWAVGPGIGTGPDSAAHLAEVLTADRPSVLDADALTLLAADPELLAVLRRRTAATVLTPHARELARLLDGDPHEIASARLRSVRAAADRYGCVVLLKGSTSLVAEPGGRVWANPTGTPALATAGTGDLLTGVIGALLAAGVAAPAAAAAGAWLHGLAGRLAADAGGVSASAVIPALRSAVAQVSEGAALRG